MALARRPARRDRRKVPNSTRGGKINTLTVCRFNQAPDGDSTIVQVVKQSADLPDPGWVAVQTTESASVPVDGFAIFDSTGQLNVESVIITGTGLMVISTSEDMVGATTVVIPPFLDGLRSLDGWVCAGGVLEAIAV